MVMIVNNKIKLKVMKKSVQLGALICLFMCSFGLFAQNMNESLSDIRVDLQQVRDIQESMLQSQLQSRVQKVVNTSDFVRSANISLNALILSNSLTDYLNNVSDLNNPSNKDLGFSLVKVVDDMVEEQIFQGRKKAGGSSRGKFFQIINNILEMPLTQTLTSSIPIVSSLTSISQMVTNTVIADKDLSARDLSNFRDELGVYVAHYEGLAIASNEFKIKVELLSERTIAVSLMLRNFTYQRIGALDDQVIQTDKLKGQTLAEIILNRYDQATVRKKVKAVLMANLEGNKINYQNALASKELDYPDFVVNEARFILDEIETISQEYIVAFEEYQEALENVLNHSKDFGDPDKIDRKIGELRKKLTGLESAFLNAVHVEEVIRRFDVLVDTDPDPEELLE